MFSEAMDWQSVATKSSEDVVIYPVNGGHRSGSSQIKVKNIVDSSWDKAFHWGNLVATHCKGQYFAYALTGYLYTKMLYLTLSTKFVLVV